MWCEILIVTVREILGEKRDDAEEATLKIRRVAGIIYST